MVAIVIVIVVVGSISDWQKEMQFKKLNEKKEDCTVKVIRDGAEKGGRQRTAVACTRNRNMTMPDSENLQP
ncbi:hypothetical protein DFH11DRAFT_1820534 [Phellopilus nigrolimitatus]|nr:hypothetical protein DFH11DRAFT_1820534 [Phellopilus nigrolimitatus]